MAESQDVCYSIAHALDALITPLNGTTYPIPEYVDQVALGSTFATVPPTNIILSRPLQKDLEDFLSRGDAYISVEPDETDAHANQYTNEGRSQDLIARLPLTVTATQTASASGLAWTIGGATTAGNIIGVQNGSLGAAYVVLGTDTDATIASGLASAANAAGIAASSSGSTFTVLGSAGYATVQVGASSTWLQGVSRRARSFDVVLWCASPHLRHYYLTLTDNLFAPGQKLAMPDGSNATVLGGAGVQSFVTRTSDRAERDNLFLARERWLIEYVTTRVVTKDPVVAISMTLVTVAPNLSAPLLASQL